MFEHGSAFLPTPLFKHAKCPARSVGQHVCPAEHFHGSRLQPSEGTLTCESLDEQEQTPAMARTIMVAALSTDCIGDFS